MVISEGRVKSMLVDFGLRMVPPPLLFLYFSNICSIFLMKIANRVCILLTY